MAKLKFGTYSIKASVTVEDEVDLEEHFTKKEWNKLKEREQREWFEEYCETLATSDLEMSWKLNE
jgi:hypothetical protein